MFDELVVCPPAQELRRLSGRKWSRYGPDIIPAWIADMDFAPAPVIRDALAEAVAHGDFGYGPTAAASGVPEAFARWAARRWDWRVDPDDVLLSPDVVGGLANCVEALTEPGDAVLVQTPAYPPLMACVRAAGRRLVTRPLSGAGLQADALNETLKSERVRMIILCHPHNPMGRCWNRSELADLVSAAAAHNVVVVSDEVHADLTYPPHKHTPLAGLGPEAAALTVTLTAASKAFNIAGLRTAVCIAENPQLRARLASLPGTRWNAFSTLGLRATLAAWSVDGERWLDACVKTLMARRSQLNERLGGPLAEIAWRPPDAGYLAWLDCRALGLPQEPADFFLNRARVALSSGADFGTPGEGFARLNFATSATILGELLDRLAASLIDFRGSTHN